MCVCLEDFFFFLASPYNFSYTSQSPLVNWMKRRRITHKGHTNQKMAKSIETERYGEQWKNNAETGRERTRDRDQSIIIVLLLWLISFSLLFSLISSCNATISAIYKWTSSVCNLLPGQQFLNPNCSFSFSLFLCFFVIFFRCVLQYLLDMNENTSIVRWFIHCFLCCQFLARCLKVKMKLSSNNRLSFHFFSANKCSSRFLYVRP